jgi:hypothetical protein|tara:strand:- start:5329 stop:5739 length:411 start_codon:yes stop_codon:yes gene_type:complete
MKFTIEISPDTIDSEHAGEVLLDYFVGDDPDWRWGWDTTDFDLENVSECAMTKDDLLAATMCCGIYTKIKMDEIRKFHLVNDNLMVYLCDDRIVIRHLEEDWFLGNSNVRNSMDWAWVDEDNWVKPNHYYLEKEDQ